MKNVKKAAKTLSKLFLTMFDACLAIFITYKHTGKMAGMYSLSTSALLNPYCVKRAKNKKSICAFCFSAKMLNNSFYKSLRKRLEHNTRVLTTRVLDVVEWPLINAHSFRLESFGDLQNTTQCINYFNFCNVNKIVNFALWTKNPFIIANTIRAGYEKPENLIIVYSSPIINKAVDLQKMQNVFPFIDKVFTVWDSAESAVNAGVKINCGAAACIKCLQCYKKDGENVISELLK